VSRTPAHFVHGKASSEVSALHQDVVTGADSQRTSAHDWRGEHGGALRRGRVLSLFRSKIDTLTVQYRDADGGLHGAIFTMRSARPT